MDNTALSIFECDFCCCLLVLSADNLCKQVGPRSSLTKQQPNVKPNCLTLMVFLTFISYHEKISLCGDETHVQNLS